MKKVNVYLKSGRGITVVCERIISHLSRTGKLINYEFIGVKQNNPLYIDITDVSAVVEEMGNEDGNARESEEN